MAFQISNAVHPARKYEKPFGHLHWRRLPKYSSELLEKFA
jgi:hypothetical protein